MIFLDDRLPQNSTRTIQLTAVIDTALCVGAGGSSGSLADKPIVRNAKGQLLIPASQLKGRLRHECEKLARGMGWIIFESPKAEALRPTEVQFTAMLRELYQERLQQQTVAVSEAEFIEQFKQIYRQGVEAYSGYHCLVSKLFGNPALPSRIVVDDLICPLEKPELPEVMRPGVTINRRRGTAEDQKLYLLETSPANAQLEFRGTIHLLAGCPDYAEPLLLAGLQHIHALGGSKSAGLGWLTWQVSSPRTINDAVWAMLLPPGGGV